MFGLKNYVVIINFLLDHEFKFSTDWSVDSHSKTVLMRHDIDFSLDDALIMAKIEKDLNFRATYFFMLTSNTYNLLSKRSRDIVLEIKEMGHKVSLHFDPTVYDGLDAYKQEQAIFEKSFNTEIDIVSIHRPGKFLDNNNLDLYGIKQTYQDRFFKEFKYLSDSGGKDVLPSISSFLDSSSKQALHLLIHPVWWVRRLNSQTSTLNQWRQEHFEIITDEIRRNCKTYTD
jgi:hypothetical protein